MVKTLPYTHESIFITIIKIFSQLSIPIDYGMCFRADCRRHTINRPTAVSNLPGNLPGAAAPVGNSEWIIGRCGLRPSGLSVREGTDRFYSEAI